MNEVAKAEQPSLNYIFLANIYYDGIVIKYSFEFRTTDKGFNSKSNCIVNQINILLKSNVHVLCICVAVCTASIKKIQL